MISDCTFALDARLVGAVRVAGPERRMETDWDCRPWFFRLGWRGRARWLVRPWFLLLFFAIFGKGVRIESAIVISSYVCGVYWILPPQQDCTSGRTLQERTAVQSLGIPGEPLALKFCVTTTPDDEHDGSQFWLFYTPQPNC